MLSVALAAGHLAQAYAARIPAKLTQATAKEPIHIVNLSAGPDESGLTADLRPLKTGQDVQVVADRLSQSTSPLTAETAVCAPVLHLMPRPGAMMEVSIAAPCDAGTRVVLSHAGLSVTERLNAEGSLAVRLPVMDETARFDMRLDNGRTASATQAIPDLAGVRRFAVQWAGATGFVLHGMENGADFGQQGDVSPNQPGIITNQGGWLSVLGDASVHDPLLAQVYTFPAETMADVVVEAPVTSSNCGHKLLGKTLTSTDGMAAMIDLTLEMPNCTAVGEFLVLKNLAQTTKLAAK